ncbi:aspartic peptidase domain-containing protein [Apiospora phragmitis]|uniref:Aspartic peptidase domain-containing protein n=1 Tax=Apiospora phragmitis TaxID=2905665 RepID=A0ABR1X7E6_9PEZI
MVAIAPAASTLAMPVFYQPLLDQQVITNISWGTPASEAIPTVVDTGSYGFWVAGPDAIVNSGSPYLGVMGPCNQTVEPAFNWPESSTHTGPYDEQRATFAYGGGGKIINCPTAVNDTMSFAGSGYPAIPNVQVASCEFIHIKDRSTTCEGAHYDRSIMGLAPIPSVGGGPELHPELLKQGRLASSVFSMWFDAPPADINEPQMGSLLSAPSPPRASTPATSSRCIMPVSTRRRRATTTWPCPRCAPPTSTAMQPTRRSSPSPTRPTCPIASWTRARGHDAPDQRHGLLRRDRPRGRLALHQPPLPVPVRRHSARRRLRAHLHRQGRQVRDGQDPLPQHGQGPGLEPNTCRLNLQLGDPKCTFGGTFYASAFVVHDDEAETLQIAQGAVAGSAQGPPSGLRL